MLSGRSLSLLKILSRTLLSADQENHSYLGNESLRGDRGILLARLLQKLVFAYLHACRVGKSGRGLCMGCTERLGTDERCRQT